MVKITFEINGRKTDARNMKDAFESAILSGVTNSIKSSVGQVYCAEHKQYPEILAKGRNLDSLNFEVKGCCNDVIEQVKRKLK